MTLAGHSDLTYQDESQVDGYPLFLIQHPAEDRKFLKRVYPNGSSAGQKKPVGFVYDILPTPGTKGAAELLVRDFLFFFSNLEKTDNDRANLFMSPMDSDGKDSDGRNFAFPQVLYHDNKDLVLYYVNEVNRNSKRHNDGFVKNDLKNGSFKFVLSPTNHKHLSSDGTSKPAKCCPKYRKVLVSELQPDHWNTGVGGFSYTLDIVEAITKTPEKDGSQDGPAQFASFASDVGGRDEDFVYYLRDEDTDVKKGELKKGKKAYFELSGGQAGTKYELTPGSSFMIPTSALSWADHDGGSTGMNASREKGKKMEYKVFYLTTDKTTDGYKALYTKFLDDGGQRAAENSTRSNALAGFKDKICTTENKGFFERITYDEKTTTCQDYVNDRARIEAMCQEDNAAELKEGGVCTVDNLGEDSYNAFVRNYCNKDENKANDPSCMKFLIWDLDAGLKLCEEDSEAENCKVMMDKYNSEFSLESAKAGATTATAKAKAYMNTLVTMAPIANASTWEPMGYHLPDNISCDTVINAEGLVNSDIIHEGCQIDVKREVHNTQINQSVLSPEAAREIIDSIEGSAGDETAAAEIGDDEYPDEYPDEPDTDSGTGSGTGSGTDTDTAEEEEVGTGLSPGAIAGIVIAVVVVLILFFLAMRRR